MKCPRCGHWNKPSFPRCFQCGEPLSAKDAKTPAWREQFETPKPQRMHVIYDDAQPTQEDIVEEKPQEAKPKETVPQNESLAAEMNRLKDRRARGTVYLEQFRKNASEQGIAPSGSGVSIRRGGGFFSDVPDNPKETVQTPPELRDRRRDAAASTAPAHSVDELLEEDGAFLPLESEERPYDDDPDEDVPMSFDSPMPLAPPRRKKRRRPLGPMAVPIWTMRILALAALGFIIWQGALFLEGRDTPAVTTAGEAIDATITPITMDGLSGHRIQIKGEEGTQIYISELTRSYVVIGGMATIEVVDHFFYDKLPNVTEPQMTVTLTPTAIRSGVETRLTPINYLIDIPLSPLQVLSPETSYTEVNTSIYNLRLQVQPGSRVTVNGRDITDTVDEDGMVSDNPPVKAIGENYIVITAKAPYCRENNAAITLYREPQEIPLELAAATLLTTRDLTMTIRATTQPGATVTIESPYQNLITTNLATTGEFSFEAIMQKTGYNVVKIRVSYEGKADSTLDHTVYHVPKAADYTKKAWALSAKDYSELVNNINLRAQEARIYLCKGVIKEVLSAKPQLAIMDTGTDGKEQLVMLQNESTETWEVGQTWRVYADVTGLYDTIPRLIGRYSYPP